MFLFERIRSGGRTGTLVVPTVADHRREGRETVTFRIRLGRKSATRTVRVVD